MGTLKKLEGGQCETEELSLLGLQLGMEEWWEWKKKRRKKEKMRRREDKVCNGM